MRDRKTRRMAAELIRLHHCTFFTLSPSRSCWQLLPGGTSCRHCGGSAQAHQLVAWSAPPGLGYGGGASENATANQNRILEPNDRESLGANSNPITARKLTHTHLLTPAGHRYHSGSFDQPLTLPYFAKRWQQVNSTWHVSCKSRCVPKLTKGWNRLKATTEWISHDIIG